MASKKEHKRRQKTQGRRGKSPARPLYPLYPGQNDINSLDLLKQIRSGPTDAEPAPPEENDVPEHVPSVNGAREDDASPYSESSSTSVILRKQKSDADAARAGAADGAAAPVESPYAENVPPSALAGAVVEADEPDLPAAASIQPGLPEPSNESEKRGEPCSEPGPEPEPAPEPQPPEPATQQAISLDIGPDYWEKKVPDLPEPAPAADNPFAAYGYQAPPPVEPPPPAAPVKYEQAPPEAMYQGKPPGEEDDELWIMPNHRTTAIISKEKSLYIVMITPEVAPCAKVGGLGDVVQGLGRELVNRGHGVEIIAPMYSSMRYEMIEDLHEVYGELWCPHYNQWRAEKVFQGRVGGGLQANFITGGNYTERPAIYGFDDDLYRFTYFCRQALEFMYKTDRRPDIIHCHDWTTGVVPALLWDIYQPLGWDNSRVVYTIHNNECQGLCGFGDKLLSMVGLDLKNYMRPDRMQDDIHKNCINLMKAGIVYSNFTTTVSPTFAGELKTVAGGRGLQTTIAKNSAKIGGVLNGLDYDAWNPQTDPKIAARYSNGEDFYEKYKNKTALREWLGLWDAWKPIVSVVTRLTEQKGLDLIKRSIFSTLEEDGQFVLLGSAPDPKVNDDFLRLQDDLKDNHDVNLYIGYHEDLARLIYAGSDIFVVPSLFEPCGLTQMIALRYGTVPVVRETGGLSDTVFDLENSGRGLNDANGFSFRDPTPASLDYGLKRAVRLWFDNPAAFNRLARNGMRYNYSWKNPAADYENIYNFIKA